MGQQAQPNSKKRGQNAIQLLTADHVKVSKIFKQYQKISATASDEDKGLLVTQACNELSVHAQIEEEIFYPAMRGVEDLEDLLDEAKVEHTSIKDLVTDLQGMNPEDELYDATFAVLTEYVTHHVEEEQHEIFPRAKKSGVDLNQLGEELARRKQELAEQLGMDAKEMPARITKRTGSATPAPRSPG